MDRRVSHFAAWLACFAILLAALAPSVSAALAAERTGVVLGELCSATGAKRFSIWSENSRDPSAPAKSASHAEHCPFCQVHGGVPGLLPPEPFALPVACCVERLAQLPTLLLHAQSAWPSGQPRGPPSLS